MVVLVKYWCMCIGVNWERGEEGRIEEKRRERRERESEREL